MYELSRFDNETTRENRPIALLALGAVVGAGIALLLAAPGGRDVRRQLQGAAQRVGFGAKNVIGRARQAINGVKEDARIAVDLGRETFERTSRDPASIHPIQPIQEERTYRRVPAG
jgi:hypothetical protein